MDTQSFESLGHHVPYRLASFSPIYFFLRKVLQYKIHKYTQTLVSPVVSPPIVERECKAGGRVALRGNYKRARRHSGCKEGSEILVHLVMIRPLYQEDCNCDYSTGDGLH